MADSTSTPLAVHSAIVIGLLLAATSFYTFLFRPLIVTVLTAKGYQPDFPLIDTGIMRDLVYGLLAAAGFNAYQTTGTSK